MRHALLRTVVGALLLAWTGIGPLATPTASAQPLSLETHASALRAVLATDDLRLGRVEADARMHAFGLVVLDSLDDALARVADVARQRDSLAARTVSLEGTLALALDANASLSEQARQAAARAAAAEAARDAALATVAEQAATIAALQDALAGAVPAAEVEARIAEAVAAERGRVAAAILAALGVTP